RLQPEEQPGAVHATRGSRGETGGRRPRAASHGRGEIRIRQPRAKVPADLLQHRVRQPQVHAAGDRHHLRAAAARSADARRAARPGTAHGRVAGCQCHRSAARGARGARRRRARHPAAARSRPARFALGAVVRGIAGDAGGRRPAVARPGGTAAPAGRRTRRADRHAGRRRGARHRAGRRTGGVARGAGESPAGTPRVNLPAWVQSAGLLVVSNVFMTFAWYAHLKNMASKPWVIAALASWGIALFEYLVQVPANRIGYTTLSLGQLKVMQEVITLAVFVPFAMFYMRQPLKLDFLWAGLCLVAAAYFMFRR